MEVGKWKLVRARYPTFTGIDSYPIHACGREGQRDGHVVRGENGFGNKCIRCREKIPPEILGLWTLHNWDVATNHGRG
jgi:hypothetical protein